MPAALERRAAQRHPSPDHAGKDDRGKIRPRRAQEIAEPDHPAGEERQRLARLLIDSRQADAALKLVANGDSLATLEVRGDAQMALGQREQARDSYNKALLKAEVGTPQRRVLELKLTDAGGTPPKTESQS